MYLFQLFLNQDNSFIGLALVSSSIFIYLRDLGLSCLTMRICLCSWVGQAMKLNTVKIPSLYEYVRKHAY